MHPTKLGRGRGGSVYQKLDTYVLKSIVETHLVRFAINTVDQGFSKCGWDQQHVQ